METFDIEDVHCRLRESKGVVVSDSDARLVLERIETDYPKEGMCWPNIDICYLRLLIDGKLPKKVYCTKNLKVVN